MTGLDRDEDINMIFTVKPSLVLAESEKKKKKSKEMKERKKER